MKSRPRSYTTQTVPRSSRPTPTARAETVGLGLGLQQLDHEAVQDVAFGYEYLREIEDLHHRQQDLGTCDDDVRPARIEGRDPLPLLDGERYQPTQQQSNV